MITTFYPPHHFGGDALYVYRLSNALAERGHCVDVIYCADSYDLLARDTKSHESFPHHPRVTVHALKSEWGFLSPLATQQTGRPYFKKKSIESVLNQKSHEVIHFHNISLVGGPGVLELGQGIKLYTTHEHWLECPTHVLWKYNRALCRRKNCFACQIIYKRPPQLWRHAGILQRSLKCVDAFLAPSQFTLHRHQDAGIRGRFVHLPFFLPKRNAVIEVGAKNPIAVKVAPHPRPYFLFVGRLEKIKGVQFLLEVWKQYSGADLLIAGTGDYEATLRQMARSASNVFFLGHQSSFALAELYRHAIALLVPSLGFEVFGIVVLEAFREGTPVIVNRVGALPEIVERSGGGLIYDYGDQAKLVDAMERLRRDEEYREHLGERGRQMLAGEWSEEVHLQRYFEIIHAIAAEKKMPVHE